MPVVLSRPKWMKILGRFQKTTIPLQLFNLISCHLRKDNLVDIKSISQSHICCLQSTALGLLIDRAWPSCLQTFIGPHEIKSL
jgi:hypothetical protein